MKDNKLETVMSIGKTIIKAGGEVYLVGGCVRDWLLGKTPTDYDMVTSLKPDALEKLFQGRNVNLVGKSFGVMIIDDVEVATFRKDLYSADEIHSKGADSVEYANTIEEDLSRRDFSINAIALKCNFEEEGIVEYIDPFNGKKDLRDNVIRFVGNPADRIKEDPCRILRAFRFASVLGFEMENIPTICSMRPYFLLIAPERIRLELLKVLSKSDDLIGFFTNLKGCNLLKYIFPCLEDCSNIEGGPYHNEDVFMHNLLAANSISKKYPLIRLAALLHDVGKAQTISRDEEGNAHFYNHEVVSEALARRALENLKFSNKEIDYVCDIIKNHMFFFEEITKDSTYRRFMSKLKVPVRDVLRMRIADRRGNLLKKNRAPVTFMFKKTLKRIRKIEKEDKCFKLKDLAINGNDLIRAGYSQGPMIGKILQMCLERVLEDQSCNNKELLLGYVRKVMMIDDVGGLG